MPAPVEGGELVLIEYNSNNPETSSPLRESQKMSEEYITGLVQRIKDFETMKEKDHPMQIPATMGVTH